MLYIGQTINGYVVQTIVGQYSGDRPSGANFLGIRPEDRQIVVASVFQPEIESQNPITEWMGQAHYFLPVPTLPWKHQEQALRFLLRETNLTHAAGLYTEPHVGELHEPTGLPAIIAEGLPPELLALEGVSSLLSTLKGHWDDGDQWGSAMQMLGGVVDAMYGLQTAGEDIDIPDSVGFSPGAWHGDFSAHDIWHGGPGGDHEVAVEVLQDLEQESAKAIDQLERLCYALNSLCDRLKAEGKDY